MALIDVRKMFINDYSGRYDLVVDTTSYADNGADKFIRAGQKWLARTFMIGANNARHFQHRPAGTWYVLVPQSRVIYSVWMSAADGSRWQLEKLDFRRWRELTPNDPGLTSAGAPTSWTAANINTEPNAAIIGIGLTTIDRLESNTYTSFTKQWENNGVLWTPPTSQDVTVEVHGTFMPYELLIDQNENFWTEMLPHVLAMAGCRALEQSYRNMQGVQDWESSIRSELLGMELDLADEESTGVTHMEGTGL